MTAFLAVVFLTRGYKLTAFVTSQLKFMGRDEGTIGILGRILHSSKPKGCHKHVVTAGLIASYYFLWKERNTGDSKQCHTNTQSTLKQIKPCLIILWFCKQANRRSNGFVIAWRLDRAHIEPSSKLPLSFTLSAWSLRVVMKIASSLKF